MAANLGKCEYATASILEKETIPSDALLRRVQATKSQDTETVQQKDLIQDTVTIVEIDWNQDYKSQEANESNKVTDSRLADVFSDQAAIEDIKANEKRLRPVLISHVIEDPPYVRGSNRQAMLLKRSLTSQMCGSDEFLTSRLSLDRAIAASLGCCTQPNTSREVFSSGSFICASEQPHAIRNGMGERSTLSIVSCNNDAELDFNDVQRGDTKIKPKLYSFVCACIKMNEKNLIISIHGQGADGDCNIVKEIIFSKDGDIDKRAVVFGDHSMLVLQIRGEEYQEQDAGLAKAKGREILQSIRKRVSLSMSEIEITNGKGTLTLIESTTATECSNEGLHPPPHVFDLGFKEACADMPKNTFHLNYIVYVRNPLDFSPKVTTMDSSQMDLQLLSIFSILFLSTNVDRGVTGGASTIGEQPINGLPDPKAMAKLVEEGFTNLVQVTVVSSVKANNNWTYAAKFEGDAIDFGIAINDEKYSLSTATPSDGVVVKAPRYIEIISYAAYFDINKSVTAKLKLKDDDGVILYVGFAKGKQRLAYAGLGINNGGLVIKAYEMAFAGNNGINLKLASNKIILFETLLSEELDLVMDISNKNLRIVMEELCNFNFTVEVKVDGTLLMSEKTSFPRYMWEDANFKLKKRQQSTSVVEVEKECLQLRHESNWKLLLTSRWTNHYYMFKDATLKVAVVREKDRNGDKDISPTFHAVGFEMFHSPRPPELSPCTINFWFLYKPGLLMQVSSIISLRTRIYSTREYCDRNHLVYLFYIGLIIPFGLAIWITV